ncbi:MAG: TIGR00645 family protein [Burkholderiales bacterium]|nr:TIGR00645 family protein [Burkholderiales bacterium]
MRQIEGLLESYLFRARWLLAPMYMGLALVILLVNIKFIRLFYEFCLNVFSGTANQLVVGVLTLIDVVMLANLLIIFLFAGYENFVSKFSSANEQDRPAWMGHVGFADLKIKLAGSIVAISAIELLKAFMELDDYTDRQLAWKLGLHGVFVVSGVLFAVMDRLNRKGH